MPSSWAVLDVNVHSPAVTSPAVTVRDQETVVIEPTDDITSAVRLVHPPPAGIPRATEFQSSRAPIVTITTSPATVPVGRAISSDVAVDAPGVSAKEAPRKAIATSQPPGVTMLRFPRSDARIDLYA